MTHFPQDTRRSQRTNRILVAVVLTFTLCWLPWNLFSLYVEFYNKNVASYVNLLDLLLKLGAISSSCINPFLYGWLNDNFKKELGKCCGYEWVKWFKCCKREDSVGGKSGGSSAARQGMVMSSCKTSVPNGGLTQADTILAESRADVANRHTQTAEPTCL